ncbi:GyrI-like domain-containing protein [Carnobacterium divergens]|uniref:GyrI-like domain-containing protein n=1 Tax=Carnobacterium divergens TaxID=2748 RepID=UPI00288D0BD9|nr:GyrI-like domain-containing protein [Carnobacterium divergens]MDT2010783.1 GyrI-like domain-containing protein [Carnobacterium divergens]
MTYYDWRKAEKQFYFPTATPRILKQPAFQYLIIKRSKAISKESFIEEMELLIAVSKAIKLKSNQTHINPDYQLFPIECRWILSNENEQIDFQLMIRQPRFINEKILQQAVLSKNTLAYQFVLEKAQPSVRTFCLHQGSYHTEEESLLKMENYCQSNGYQRIGANYEEIYVADFRNHSPEKLKTVLSFEIEKST